MQAAELIRKTRLAAHLNQTQAAERCGVSFSAYEKWERDAPIKPPMLAGVLLLLGAPAELAIRSARAAMK